jgi:two-component system chemotaxis response regulator CheB
MSLSPVRSDEVPHDIIVVGASAGGVETLSILVGRIPTDLPAAVFIVLHIQPNRKSLLPELLARVARLRVAHAIDGEAIRYGHIYVAPPDRHLLVEPGYVHLSTGPRENFARPAVDPLFRSAALAYGPRVTAVVLSGTLSDGTAGLWEVKHRGGTAIVQHPGDAQFADMPQNAIRQVPIDYVLPISDIPALLVRLAYGQTDQKTPTISANGASKQTRKGGEETPQKGARAMGDEGLIGETIGSEKPGSQEVKRDMAAQVSGQRDGEVTVYTCPECSGSLWQGNAGQIPRFRCHVGHVYSADNLLEGYTDGLERSLWYAVRTLRDKANLNRQLAIDAREWGNMELADRYDERAQQDEEHSATIERMISLATAVNREQ